MPGKDATYTVLVRREEKWLYDSGLTIVAHSKKQAEQKALALLAIDERFWQDAARGIEFMCLSDVQYKTRKGKTKLGVQFR